MPFGQLDPPELIELADVRCIAIEVKLAQLESESALLAGICDPKRQGRANFGSIVVNAPDPGAFSRSHGDAFLETRSSPGHPTRR